MKKLMVFCPACNQDIDISTMPFVDYNDEAPMILDIQLTGPPFHQTSELAVAFAKKHHPEFSAEDDSQMYHYENAKVSHMEAGDESHTLRTDCGYWSPV